MEINGKNILVLGGSGEVGAAICKHLLFYEPATMIIAPLDGQAQKTVNSLSEELPSAILYPSRGMYLFGGR